MLSGMSGDDFKSITASAQNVYNSFAPLMSDPKGAITALAQVVAQKGGSALVSRVIAQPLCKALLPKYITQQDDASAVLEKMGVVNGLDGLDFSLSTFLMDQRTINVVLVYEIDVKGFGIFDQKLIVKQTASTAAWLADTEGVKLSDVASKTSAWQKSDMERGKDYVSELQGENPHQGVLQRKPHGHRCCHGAQLRRQPGEHHPPGHRRRRRYRPAHGQRLDLQRRPPYSHHRLSA